MGTCPYYKKPVIEKPPATGKMPSDILGKTFACSNGFIAAFTADDADRVRDLIKENDRKGIAVMVPNGRALVTKKGMIATIEDIDVWRALERFHVGGGPESLYAEIGMIE
jgi:hypothetical protein